MRKIFVSLRNINFKLYFSLILIGLIPSIYTTVRIFFMGDFPNEWSYSIAGQLSWVNLIFEIISEAIILPLYFFIGEKKNDCNGLENRIRTGLLITGVVYTLLAVIICLFTYPLLNLMSANREIIVDSATYIRIEAFANIFSTLVSFLLVVLVTVGKSFYMYIVLLVQLVLSVISDTFLVSTLSCSANLGINGIGISNIIVNIFLLITLLIILKIEKINVFKKEKLSFSWMKNFLRIGSVSGLESFVRNFAYMIMIVRMVNVVSEQGTYWMANNFIWGWLLIPIIQLGELIKRDCSFDKKAIENKTLGYFAITFFVSFLWLLSIPLWKPFMSIVLNYSEADKLFSLVLLLIGFYVLYAIQNVFDSTFYGLGKTNYMLAESVITNTFYYGGAFLLYKFGFWVPTLTGIALLFGIGNAFDSVVSLIAYIVLLKKEGKSIFNPQLQNQNL